MSDDEMDSCNSGNSDSYYTASDDYSDYSDSSTEWTLFMMGYPSKYDLGNKQVLLHPKLASFVGLQYGSRQEIYRAITEYVETNGLEYKKNSTLVRINDVLSEFLDHDDLSWSWDKIAVEKRTGQIPASIKTYYLTFATIWQCIEPLFNEAKNKYEWITQDVLNISIFMNGSQHKYLICEIVEDEIATFGEVFYML